MLLNAMVLPVPVAPATRRWGMWAKSVKMGFPATSFPREKSKGSGEFLNLEFSIRVRRRTTVRTLLGISMPTRDLPGMGASIRMGWAAKAKAKSLERAVMRASLMPSAGLKAYWVTAGPMFTSEISTGMSKFAMVFLMMAEYILISPALGTPLSDSKMEAGGN